MPMVIILALRWWYSAGWLWAWRRSVNERLQWCLETFSMPALVRTWFSPFKQTYSRAQSGSIDLKVQAAVDNLISRIIGTLARTFILLAGLVCMVGSIASGLLIVLLWPIVPLLPLVSIVLFSVGAGV